MPCKGERSGWDRTVDAPFTRRWQHQTPGPGAYGEKRTFVRKATKGNQFRVIFNRNKAPVEPVGFNSAGERECMRKSKLGEAGMK